MPERDVVTAARQELAIARERVERGQGMEGRFRCFHRFDTGRSNAVVSRVCAHACARPSASH